MNQNVILDYFVKGKTRIKETLKNIRNGYFPGIALRNESENSILLKKKEKYEKGNAGNEFFPQFPRNSSAF